MQKILVTGGNGQLGSELTVLSNKFNQFEWVFTDRSALDLCDLVHLKNELSKINPQIIINCAAHTAVDKAESEVALSDVLNHQSVGVLASIDTKSNGLFIQTT